MLQTGVNCDMSAQTLTQLLDNIHKDRNAVSAQTRWTASLPPSTISWSTSPRWDCAAASPACPARLGAPALTTSRGCRRAIGGPWQTAISASRPVPPRRIPPRRSLQEGWEAASQLEATGAALDIPQDWRDARPCPSPQHDGDCRRDRVVGWRWLLVQWHRIKGGTGQLILQSRGGDVLGR